MKKIVITGGLGFIGSNLVRKLCKNYHVVIVDKQTYSSNLDNLSRWMHQMEKRKACKAGILVPKRDSSKKVVKNVKNILQT